VNEFEQRMIGYSAYHRDPRNKFTHLFGVPMVFYSPLIALGWLRFEIAGVELTLAMFVLAAVMLWYIKLDRMFGLIMTAISLPVAYACEQISQLPFATSLTIFLAIKLSGWAIQLIGHVFEGRRPALVDNLVQSLMGPLFVLAEILFALGLRRDLHDRVETQSAAARAAVAQ
jgi:uncharacterized membrane protein YGL010W